MFPDSLTFCLRQSLSLFHFSGAYIGHITRAAPFCDSIPYQPEINVVFFCITSWIVGNIDATAS